MYIYTTADMLLCVDDHAEALSKAQQEHEKTMQAHHEKLKALQGTFMHLFYNTF